MSIQDFRDLINLAQSEANRWKTADPKTGSHWQRVADAAEAEMMRLQIAESVATVRPLVERELSAERIPQGLMEFRMRSPAQESQLRAQHTWQCPECRHTLAEGHHELCETGRSDR